MKKIRRMMAACLLLMVLLSGCGKETKLPRVSVVQIMEHTSLNTIRDSFLAKLEELGYKDGETVILDVKDAGGQQNTLNSILSTFAGNDSDVIVAIATPTAAAAANYSEDIPIVFSAVSDPIASNLTSTLEAPDKNITGTSDDIQVDQILELALEIDLDMKNLGFLYNSAEANSISNLKKAKAFCREHGLTLIEGTGKTISELQSAISVLCDQCDAIFAPNDNTVASSMAALTQTANERKVPVYTGADSMVQDGGFASVGIDYTTLGEETAVMVDQILKGSEVKDIPIKVFKDDLNTYINETTRKTLGITLPDEVAARERLVKVE